MAFAKSYLKNLKKRGDESHVYRKYQLLGLEIAHALGDEKHKALYIKMAKEYGGEELLRIAKDVAERNTVRNKGAYFMKVLAEETKKRIAARAVRGAGATPKTPKKDTSV